MFRVSHQNPLYHSNESGDGTVDNNNNNNSTSSTGSVAAATDKAAAVVVDDERSETEEAMRRRLVRFYERYDPTKLVNVSALVDAYKNRQRELFMRLIDLYGPEPSGAQDERSMPRPNVSESTSKTPVVTAKNVWHDDDDASSILEDAEEKASKATIRSLGSLTDLDAVPKHEDRAYPLDAFLSQIVGASVDADDAPTSVISDDDEEEKGTKISENTKHPTTEATGEEEEDEHERTVPTLECVVHMKVAAMGGMRRVWKPFRFVLGTNSVIEYFRSTAKLGSKPFGRICVRSGRLRELIESKYKNHVRIFSREVGPVDVRFDSDSKMVAWIEALCEHGMSDE